VVARAALHVNASARFRDHLFDIAQHLDWSLRYAARMPPRSCPNCSHDGRWLEHPSAGAYVDYYRCDCGHVWVVSKNSTHEQHDITPLRSPTLRYS
jgi:hypothetical protein